VLDGKNVYVKCYSPGGWGKDEQVVRARLRREAEVIQRVGRSGGFPKRLGMLRLLEVDLEQSRIVTDEAPGKPLDSWLIGDYRRVVGRGCLRALYLAGRWLRQFQSLDTTDLDFAPVSALEPYDLREYCRVRLQAIADLGYTGCDAPFDSNLDRALTRLLWEAGPGDQVAVLGHGDFHAGNMLWDGESLTVIDFGMASLKPKLADVATFLHRLDLLRVYFPWKRWPLAAWRRAFLRGYGRPDAERSAAFQAQTIRLWLCRLHSFLARPAPTLKDRLHNAWIRHSALSRLRAAVSP